MDSTQILRQALQAGRYDSLQGEAFTPQETNKAAVESGTALGYTLTVEADPTAELMDSMEELSFQFEEKEMKTAGERKLGELRGPRSAYITAVQEWMKVLPDMPGGEFMERMLRQLRQAGRDGRLPDAAGLLKRLGEGSGDPSHQFAMLDAMERALGGDEAELRELFAKAKGKLESEKGGEVRAGLNLAKEVNARAKTPAEMQGLRDLYRGEVLGFRSPQDCFRSLLASRGAGRLAESIDFLIRGCGIDLQSPNPSQDAVALQRILTDLQCVEVLRTVLDRMDALAAKMLSEFGETCLMNGERMTGRVIEFTEMPFVAAEDISAFVTACGVTKLLAQLYFCTTLSGIFRSLSPRLFGEDGDRFKIIDATQEHLDGLVSLQEEAEERERKGRNGRAA